jgi:hypothetical protein
MNVEIGLIIVVIILVLFAMSGRESDIETAVKRSKILEGRLKREFNAKGDGLGQLTEDVKDKLPDEVYQTLDKTIIPMRNDIVHKEGQNKLKNRQEFIQACDSVESKFDELKPSDPTQIYGLGCLVVFSIFAAIAYFLSQNQP